MADKIRMNFAAVDEMITSLTGANENLNEIYNLLDGCEKSIDEGAMEGRAGDSLKEAYVRISKAAWELVLATDEMKKDVQKARQEMEEATRSGFSAQEDGGD